MLDTLAALCLLFGGMLAISFRLAPLPPERQRWLAVTLLCVTVGIATAFHLTPNINNKGGYCLMLVHHVWPWSMLLVYPVLFIMTYFLLQAYNKLIGNIYLILVALPLTLAPFWVKMQCSTVPSGVLADLAQSLVLIVTLPPTMALFWGIVLFIWLVLSCRNNNQLIVSGVALFAEFLLLIQHSGDWLPFSFEV